MHRPKEKVSVTSSDGYRQRADNPNPSTDLFENTTMVAALIDRLTFRSYVLDMNGDSYRLKATMQNKA